jgi:uncharacterized protein YdiU (UPF0061 family)
MSAGWDLQHTYAQLPDVFFTSAQPAAMPAPRLVILNHGLAEELGLNLRSLSSDDAAALFSGQRLPEGAQPIAQAYAGHQYGSFTMLGDGRAILLGEQRTPSGKLVDIQLKGPGPTRYSRRGDGRAALGPMLREYLISEAMHAVGIPTTRSLAVVATGEPVYRTATLPGAVLTRVAASHLRVGTFEFAAARRNVEHLRQLADYAIQRHYAELTGVADKYLQFFRAVMARQAALMAQWQCVGFIHGVMNTDNMAISGETIDYGPCAFMNAYRRDTVYSSIDHGGRYAYGNQPIIAQWNLARFAEALLSLIHADQEQAVAIATEALQEFPALFQEQWLRGMRAKLGLVREETDDLSLVESLLDLMEQAGLDFTNTFRDLSADVSPMREAYGDPAFQQWHVRWHERLGREQRPITEAKAAMRSVNPAVIPRNHRVEAALTGAEQQGDLAPFEDLLAVVASPYQLAAERQQYAEPPTDECGYRTFCGT